MSTYAPADPLRALLARLKGVRQTANGWVARCPGHADRKPSLNTAGPTGRPRSG